jgi:hypothetical protein
VYVTFVAVGTADCKNEVQPNSTELQQSEQNVREVDKCIINFLKIFIFYIHMYPKEILQSELNSYVLCCFKCIFTLNESVFRSWNNTM